MSIFGTDGLRAKVNEYPMTIEIAMKIASIIGHKTAKNNNNTLKNVVVGKDTRKSCYMIESAIVAGLTSAGANVILTGPVPTPAVSMLTSSLRASYGIMISASHNSFEDNGIKIFNCNGVKITDEEQAEIEKLLQLPSEKFYTESKYVGKARRLDDVIGRYVEFVKFSVPKSLNFTKLKVVLDVANGAAYKIAPEILEELGVTLHTINNNPNGENINHECGSTFPEVLSKTVKELKFDLGISLDGDADRLIMCDEKGEIVDGDYIIGAMVKFLLEEKKLKEDSVILTVMSNTGLEKFLNSLRLKTYRTGVGDRNIITKMNEIKCNVGGEPSGHIILNDYSKTGDGILASLQVMSYLVKNNLKASDIFKLFNKVPQKLTNLKFDKSKKMNLKDEEVESFIKKIEEELGEGRILVRKSGTENVLRIMVEGEDVKKNDKITKKLVDYFQSR